MGRELEEGQGRWWWGGVGSIGGVEGNGSGHM